MTMTNRYQKTIQGNLIQIGNTLGLSKANNTLTPGTLGSIGAFISTQSIAAAGWPINTTLLFSQNSSPATLNLPVGAVVDYAELIWSASYIVPGSDITGSINTLVTLRDPQNVPHSITRDGVNFTGVTLTENGENSTNYVMSANVTTIVSNGGSGTYICGNVPATMSATANNLQYAGWSLYVAYTLFGDRVRNIIIFVGNEKSVDLPYSVPINYPGTPFPIRMFYSAGEGDAIITGDQVNTSGTPNVVFFRISTAVQPVTNPFSSQITNQSGNLDTSGPFGNLNQNPIAGTNVSGGRQGWDIGNNVNLLPAFTGPAVPNLGLDIGTNNDPAIMTSNGFVVDLNQPMTSVTKFVNKTIARANEILTYTLAYNFTQVPVPTTTIVLVDTTPNGTTFIPGSVVVNGVSQPAFNPNPPGINLGNINAPAIFTVAYQVTVDTVTNFATITNNAYGSYHFQSGGTDFFGNTISNTVNTTVDPFNAVMYKSVDKVLSFFGDTITYTSTIANSGGVITSGSFVDPIPNGTSFIPNSVVINGIPAPGQNPEFGINMGPFNPNTVQTITFQVTVSTIPTPNPIPNASFITMTYSVTPTITNNNQQLVSNTVFTQVNAAIVNSFKSASPQVVRVGDNVNYTIVLTNTGNVTANNIVFIDTIPTGTSFVTNSLFLNGVLQVGQSPAPPGFNAGSIAPGARSTITFSVQVNTVPSPNPFPNSSTSNYNYILDPNTGSMVLAASNSDIASVFVIPLDTPVKSVDKPLVTIGDVITYTVTWTNKLNGTEQNIILYDTIPSGTTFVNNSVFVNGVNQPGAVVSPPGGLPLGNLGAGAIFTVTFQVTVNTLPSPNTIPNQALIQYTFQPNLPVTIVYTDTVASNIVNSQVLLAQVNTSKGTDKAFATCGDIITYTISIPNFGNVTATNVIVSDTVPNGTTFVPGSVLANGVPTGGTPSSISVGNIAPGATGTASFKVQVQC